MNGSGSSLSEQNKNKIRSLLSWLYTGDDPAASSCHSASISRVFLAPALYSTRIDEDKVNTNSSRHSVFDDRFSSFHLLGLGLARDSSFFHSPYSSSGVGVDVDVGVVIEKVLFIIHSLGPLFFSFFFISEEGSHVWWRNASPSASGNFSITQKKRKDLRNKSYWYEIPSASTAST
ncbi:hypothetical protein B0F90DRAFT_1051722 [Multifurca ochricompacta]|uniref:Uncharacterized protein n=1 Tax=Multifurca ochricompacta TaxID=376703 RepID=A0AAD4M7Q1_9AGAM|nr:hypothetical protein B0F90DRAFT_1051722 [Multifurca ochricompacta]